MKPLILHFLLLGLLLFISQNGVSGKGNLRSESQILTQMLKYVKGQQDLSDKVEFKKMLEILTFPQYILRASFSSFGSERQKITCVACRAVLKTALEMYENGSTDDDIKDVVTNICILLNLQTEKVCRGVVELNTPIFFYILKNEPKFSPETFCGVLLQGHENDICPFQDDRFEWSVSLPPKNVLRQIPQKFEDTLKIVHMTDIHYEPNYEIGGLANCNEPCCCRKDQREQASPRWRSLDETNEETLKECIHRDSHGAYVIDLDYADDVREGRMTTFEKYNKRKKASPPAGHWGDYRSCDIPWWTVEDGFKTISENHDEIDYIYYTGDTIDHGVWETTEKLIIESITNTTKLFHETFGNIPVFSAIGNHESQPLNQYAPVSVTDRNVSTIWLYDLLAEQWGQWLSSEAKETIKLGGYYTVLLRPGFRIIVINTNLCYRYNWWVQFDPTDPSGQLKWLIDTLTKAEVSGERVHILSHIPAGIADCYATYTREYKRIVERFSDTIAAEFNGHTHKDEFKMYYSREDISKPVAVSWNGGSLTTYSNVNPNYRIYDIDPSNYGVVDMETWVYNLTEANLTPEQRPRWFLEYKFKEHYGLQSLSLAEIDNLIHRMVTTEKDLLVKDYHIFRGKSSDPFVNTECDRACVRNNLIYLTTTELYDNRKFNSLMELFDNNTKGTRN